MARESARIRSRSEQLWQVPVFLLGTTALLAVWYARPHWQPSAGERLQRDLQSLRSLLDSQQSVPEQLESVLNRVTESPAVNWTSSLHHLVGSGFQRLSESAETPTSAKLFWKKAAEQLNAVKATELVPEENKRWNYRLARLAAADPSQDPVKVIPALLATMPQDEERAEGQRLLGDCLLRMTPPNYVKAREAYREYLKAAPPRSRVGAISQARLEIGRISLSLHELDDARKKLEQIGPDAPVEIYVAARTTLAKTYLSDGDWSQALRYLEQARQVKGASAATLEQLQYELANVYLRANRSDEGMKILTELKQSNSNAGQAASLKLVLLKGIDSANSESLIAELEKVTSQPDLKTSKNECLSLNELRDICDQAYAAFQKERRFDLAERIAQLYSRFAEPGRDKLMLFETYKAWAESQPRLEDRKTYYTKAASAANELIALNSSNPVQRKEWLKQAIDLQVQSGDSISALKSFDDLIVSIGGPENVDGELWLKKSQLHMAANDLKGAIIALESGLKNPGNQEIALRVELADVLLKESRTQEAIDQLEKNLKNPELPNQAKLQERTLYSLGDAHYQLQNWTKAIEQFSQAVSYYSETNRAISARYYIGRSYWYMAGQDGKEIQKSQEQLRSSTLTDNQKADLDKKLANQKRTYRDQILNARKAFQEVEAKLEVTEAINEPASAMGRLWRNSAFAGADCCLLLGDYDTAYGRYEKLTERFVGKVEQLVALGQMYQCCQYQEKPEKAKKILTQLRTVYITLKDDVYDNTASNRSKKYWAEWLERAQKN
ncbi:tetratricopeptide repeat protein [Telmatocola sphagniphila]|uniref:Tetratricopeptide repeat protein n=1 Tax=Telmatocola sphagniphila TaxID=1123043 RepID=A0A8E6B4S9_9BACT|nr:tetratricopeptide repeat protein [Telmatocola sphagniphila]QVL31917.1 tetratricopeptide repeat protein [Telmatocola sphagniphila]